MTATWFGDRAVRVPLAHREDRAHVVAAFRAALPSCAVRAGLDAVLIEAPEPDPDLLAAVGGVVLVPEVGDAGPPRTVSISVDYQGADRDAVAGILGVSPEALVAAHQTQAWEVAMMGFAPGFGYLVPVGAMELDWGAVPRRSSPRTRVPAGSVAVAAGMSAIYPHAMPGGWHLLGSTTATLFDAQDPADPTALHPGDAVRFVR